MELRQTVLGQHRKSRVHVQRPQVVPIWVGGLFVVGIMILVAVANPAEQTFVLDI